MLVLFSLPLVTLATGQTAARVSLPAFAAASFPVGMVAFAVWWWTRRWQLPAGLGLSWRGVVLHVARWPIVCWALLNVLLRVQHPYMITPKGEKEGVPPFSMRSQAIYLLAVLVSLVAVWLYHVRATDGSVQGYLIFALLGCVYAIVWAGDVRRPVAVVEAGAHIPAGGSAGTSGASTWARGVGAAAEREWREAIDVAGLLVPEEQAEQVAGVFPALSLERSPAAQQGEGDRTWSTAPPVWQVPVAAFDQVIRGVRLLFRKT
jgi:hypothetical protein